MLLRKRQDFATIRSDRRLSLFSEREISRNRLPSVNGSRTIDQSRSPRKDINFDRYYIKPAFRYRLKDENPKKNPQSYQDETYIYKNLHNEKFWNWVHPLEPLKNEKSGNSMYKKVNLPLLEKFKHHIQSQGEKRVPLLIDQLLKEEL